ncbi:DUF3558 domain-containing protein [Nocardia terpenica]|uniref:DUF3558 family protein n=1 Tax=Nocardia terpenica TaxID=455432 RepID=UPI001893CA4D|nr:DUF3558 family protein [Nocardia terpenica]MBF6065828.1 DUF3558 domain-containing protein [Nocardia terpenica]MBF6108409.1 DUF3558 domain-containing protein [Nocardia terpenica]MBF6115943.1 DUF3558 domain-containing protein [Nocardia terpenica]MBF6123073.1 DUF3558 domain-containing protein [Nocardia terpenica]MBF6156253.1 DUF3558 domain-containing protein [Nocardia terpenica]
MGAMVVAAGAALLLAGCSSSSTGGQPTSGNTKVTATTTAAATRGENTTAAPAPAALWDPCEISDADIAEQGLLPASKKRDTNQCTWVSTANNFDLAIVSSRDSLQDRLQSGRYTDFSPKPVGGRSGIQYRASQDTNKIGCYIGITVPNGLAEFVVRNLQPDADEPCAVARRIGGALVGYLS